LVYSIHDSTEEAIRKMIEANERMLRQQHNVILNERLKLQIKTLEDAPRDEDKLEQLLKVMKRKKGGGVLS
jgi:hypothetical protein